jgi:fatty acid desaturase
LATHNAVAPPRRSVLPAIEWPTLLLILLTYAGWLAVTHAYGHWPLAVVAPVVTLLLTLHSSLQHEIVHGHPTRWSWVNRLLGIVPLSLWLPYLRYRRSHLVHHRDERLTDPVDDPESFYLTPEAAAGLDSVSHALLRAQQTLAGRMVLGPPWSIGKFLRAELRAVVRGEPGARITWLEHLFWCAPVLLWVKVGCGMPIWIYLLAMVIPSNAILLIRSFAEHRARPGVRQRIAIVEDSWLLGPLFLFNNLHSLHHEMPSIPWYRYHSHYSAQRARLIAENGGLVYRTYFDVARRFLFRPHDDLLHPAGRVSADQAGRS